MAKAAKKTATKAPASGLARRLRAAMNDHEPPWTEADLVSACRSLAPEAEREKVSQPMVNYVLSGQAERSFYTPLFAYALGVSAAWLAMEIGEPRAPKNGDIPRDERALLQAYNALPKELRTPIRMMIESSYQLLREKYHDDVRRIDEARAQLLAHDAPRST